MAAKNGKHVCTPVMPSERTRSSSWTLSGRRRPGNAAHGRYDALIPSMNPKTSSSRTWELRLLACGALSTCGLRCAWDLLAGVEESLGIEGPLDVVVQRYGSWGPLVRELAALDEPDAVFAGDRSRSLIASSNNSWEARWAPASCSSLSGASKECGVQVAVARMSPTAGRQPIMATD